MDAYHEERGQEKDPLLDIDRPSINKGNTPSPPPYEHEPSHVTVKGYVQWFSSLPRDQKLRTISFFVLPVEIGVFLFMFGVYFQMQVYQQYYYQRIFRSIIANWTNVSDLNFSIYDICLSQDQIVNLTSPDTFVTGQKHINIYSMLTTIAFLLPSIMISPLIGTLSDQVGRKPAMLLVFGGQILSGILGVCIVYFDLHMLCFLATSFITGISGGFGMMMSSSFAYVTDITPKKFLTVRMAAVEASIFVGTGISSAISDMWIEKTHCTFKAQVWLILAVQICGFIFSLLIRESLSKENMVESFTKIKWGFHRIAKGFKLFFWPSYIGINLWKVWVVVIVIVLAMINETGSSEITGYFLYNKPLQWSIGEVGRYLLVSSFSHLLALLFLLPLLVLLKFSDPLISMIGVIVSCVMNVYIALLTTTWEMFSVAVIIGVQSMVIPSVRSYVAKFLKEDDHGAAFSLVAVFQLLATLIASIAFNLVYTPEDMDNNRDNPRVVFWMAAGIWAAAVPLLFLLLIADFVKCLVQRKHQHLPEKRL